MAKKKAKIKKLDGKSMDVAERAKLKTEIEKVLKKDARLWDEEQTDLNQTLLLDLVERTDEAIISLLLKNPILRKKFFTKIKDVFVFKTNDFRFFIEENKIDNSYTQYKNRIGLSDGRRFLKDSRDVVLSFPYKDCVLEGGQTKDDGIDVSFPPPEKNGKYEKKETKRKEIFFNEVLAQDEIDRLFDKKAFVNWKRYTKSGEKSVGEIKRNKSDTIQENMIIKGNNLLALHSLKQKFTGKVKLIYIDPPYNTGGATDSFAYNNTFNHSTWLTFMKNRLEVSKNLLKENGFICVAIDHHELFYLGALADEIFGKQNRIAIITVQHNPKGRNQDSFFSENCDYMLVYAKDRKEAKFNNVAIDAAVLSRFDELDKNGKFRYENFIRARSDRSRKKRPKNWYPLYVSKDLKVITSEKKKGYYEVFPTTDNGDFTWKNIQEKFEELNDGDYFKAKIENEKVVIYHKYREQQVFKNVWVDKKYQSEFHGTNILKKLLGKGVRFSYPKSLYTVLDTLKIMTSDDDIVLDFFAGSGTTAHALMQLNKDDGGNRKFILVEQMDYVEDVTRARVQAVIEKEKLETNFVYFELAKWNEQAREKIMACKNFTALKKLFDGLYEKYFLNYNVKIEKFKEEVMQNDHFKALPLEEQKKIFHAMLDLNQMYICQSEMEDKRFGIAKEDQKLTNEFYNE